MKKTPKAIEVNVIITGIRAKVDGSLGLAISTPELTPEEKTEFMRLQNVNCIALITPIDDADAPKHIVDREIEIKTPSQRLRNSLYVLYEQSGTKGDFETFYKNYMDKFIDAVKSKLI